MPNMCTGAFYVLQTRLNNSCAIYAIYTVVRWVSLLQPAGPFASMHIYACLIDMTNVEMIKINKVHFARLIEKIIRPFDLI